MRALALALALLLTLPLQAATYSSPEERVPLVELFTSQGCSSCPPADRWLSTLLDRLGLWQQFIPLAFHVDYWDYIGWKDRFAQPRNSARQRNYRDHGRVGSVYTPGLVIDGREWRGFFSGGQPPLQLGPKVGRMTLELIPDASVKVDFRPLDGQLPERLTLNVALLGFALTTPVGRGENAGKQLREDFVVLKWQSREVETKLGEWKLPWPHQPDRGTGRQAVAAWLSAPGSPIPIQAVAGWLP